MTFELIGREVWGAVDTLLNDADPCPADGAVLHHMVGLYQAHPGQRALQAFHMAPPRRWRDTGYNATVDVTDLSAYEHRGRCKVGAHAPGWNGRPGVGVGGNFEVREVTGELLGFLAAGLVWMADEGWISEAKFLGGHRDAPGAATSCPAGLHPHIGDINAMASEGSFTEPKPKPSPAPDVRPPTPDTVDVVIGMLGLQSRRWGSRTGRRIVQGLLAATRADGEFAPRSSFSQLAGRRTRPDGAWGDGTESACRAAQEAFGLLVDGVVGPATFSKLLGSTPDALVSMRHSPRSVHAGRVQMMLAARGFAPERSFRFLPGGRAVPDRQFGSASDGAVRAFQRSRRIGVDGIVGPQTWRELVS